MYNSYDALEVIKKWLNEGYETFSFTVIQVIKVQPQASKVPVACLHNLLLILFLKVMQFPVQIYSALPLQCLVSVMIYVELKSLICTIYTAITTAAFF